MRKSVTKNVCIMLCVISFLFISNVEPIFSYSLHLQEQKREPLTLKKIEQLLQNKILDEVIAGEIHARGIGFEVDKNMLEYFRSRGAGSKTIAELTSLLSKPKPTASLRIISNLPACEVLINGEVKGITDSTGVLVVSNLLADKYQVTIQHKFCVSRVYRVSLYEDKQEEVRADLDCQMGYLTVTCNVPGANILIEKQATAGERGEVLGSFHSSVIKAECSPGEYFITVSAPGYKPKARSKTVSTGVEISANFNLNKGDEAPELIAKLISANTKALISAAMIGNKNMVVFLLNKPDVDINAKDDSGRTALMYAVIGGHPDTVGMILSKASLDVNIRDNDGATALIYAALGNHDNIVRKLIGSRANINVKDKLGRTPLSVSKQNPVIADILRRNGARE